MLAVLRPPVLAFALALSVLAGCGGEAESSSQPVALKVIDADKFSGVAEARTVLVADAPAFAALWEEHRRDKVDQTAPPRIDFSQQMVLAVFAGPRPDSCASIAIQKVYRTSTRLVVEYTEAAPDASITCASVVTQPAQIVTVARGPGPVEFVKVK